MMNNALEGQELLNKITGKLKGMLMGNTLVKSNLLLYFVLIILALKIIAIGIHVPMVQNFFFADITKIDLVTLLNENRQSLGLGTLKESETLNQVAMEKALDMVKNGYFSHESPSGLTPWFWFKKVGYIYKYAGENLAVGFADSKTVYDAWFNSPSHKANLLNANYTEVGTAVVTGFQGNAILVVQEFGNPLTKPVLVQAPKPTPKPKAPSVPLVVEKTNQNTVIETIPAVQDTAPAPETTVIPKQVLGGSTEYIAPPDNIRKDTFYYRFLNFAIYQYSALLEYLSSALLILIIFSIMFNIFLKVEHFNEILMIRGVVLILLLVASISIDKNMISQIVSHQIII